MPKSRPRGPQLSRVSCPTGQKRLLPRNVGSRVQNTSRLWPSRSGTPDLQLQDSTRVGLESDPEAPYCEVMVLTTVPLQPLDSSGRRGYKSKPGALLLLIPFDPSSRTLKDRLTVSNFSGFWFPFINDVYKLAPLPVLLGLSLGDLSQLHVYCQHSRCGLSDILLVYPCLTFSRSPAAVL